MTGGEEKRVWWRRANLSFAGTPTGQGEPRALNLKSGAPVPI